MRKNTLLILSVVVLLAFVLFFGTFLFSYVMPMDDVYLDLSTTANYEHISTASGDHSWTVFVQDADARTELEPTGTGAFRGIELGQTFYFSRVMSEELDSPTLQLGALNRMFSIWLDDVLIYTDCPELDNRIGYVTLPMSEWERTEPLILSLPRDYQGKTLTIAQSFPTYMEGSMLTAIPASVKLYCGYSYESGLIAESTQTAFSALALFLTGVLLLLSFLRSQDWSILCISLTVFAWMVKVTVSTSYFYTYYGQDWTQFTWFPVPVAAGALLCFLYFRVPEKKRWLAICPVAYWIALLILLICTILDPYTISTVFYSVPTWIAWIGLTVVLLLGAVLWWKESRFYRLFTPLALLGIVLSWGRELLMNERLGAQLLTDLQSGNASYIYLRQLPPMLIAALFTAVAEALKAELDRRTEKQLLDQQRELALASYDHMRHQHEEVMMLRHDMMKHFHVLQGMNSNETVSAYLNDLIGQNQKIRPVVQTQNEMLNIMLNSRLSNAAAQGIQVEILRAEAPESLPISDADLCSMILNILDNAVAAASAADASWIRIDFHVKQHFFAFCCENSASVSAAAEKKETVQKHGFGMKIIQSLAKQHGGLAELRQLENSFRARIVLPLG